ncbi:TetR/AcrR family transcriptional regulator [Paenibacillus sp. MER 99-2]|uniref:TetR/AcrR family transcriptional regulator n=1 Tax=Paenibacillus sp. MER 99-2 TaxID=2939572 RepID=UPI00203B00A7|nr:TetR/AcrR family transcriptional regulator [Paenibacillus sp. MER 99-2]MCM3170903.1 TetR/AcrR family transcriptional regulator [Paenibacillus sp. MER 99-2]
MKEKPYHHGNLRSQLIEAGIRLINEDGLKSFSLRRVAAKCNVSHTAPYSHFENVDELLAAMGEHVTAQFMNKLHTAIDGQEDSREAVSLLGQAYIDFFVDHPPYFQFLFYHSKISINLDNYDQDDYPPFVLFRTTAYRMFRSVGLPEEQCPQQLIALWAMVHGIASLLTNNGVRFSGNWRDYITIQTPFQEGK